MLHLRTINQNYNSREYILYALSIGEIRICYLYGEHKSFSALPYFISSTTYSSLKILVDIFAQRLVQIGHELIIKENVQLTDYVTLCHRTKFVAADVKKHGIVFTVEVENFLDLLHISSNRLTFFIFSTNAKILEKIEPVSDPLPLRWRLGEREREREGEREPVELTDDRELESSVSEDGEEDEPPEDELDDEDDEDGERLCWRRSWRSERRPLCFFFFPPKRDFFPLSRSTLSDASLSSDESSAYLASSETERRRRGPDSRA